MTHTSRLCFPLITIGITCYNAKSTVSGAVEGALRQSWENVEIVITDDGSTDGSWSILQECALANPQIRLIRMEKNGGVGAARQRLVEEAQGEFLVFFDDDDESLPERLARQYQRIFDYEAAHPGSAVLCYSNRDVVRTGEESPAFTRFGIGRKPPEPSGSLVADHVLGLVKEDGAHSWGMIGSCTMMARTATFREFGGFDAQFRRCAELDFAIRAAFAGAHFISVDAPLITQYLTDTADKAGDADLRYRLLLLQKHKAYLDSKRAYRGAVANIRAWFHQTRGHRWRGRLWRALAFMLFPWQISWKRVRRNRWLVQDA
jgi:glycosyltransferase involved in cell wall biosynthesis